MTKHSGIYYMDCWILK